MSQVAQIILAQLGGNRFCAMVGAKMLVAGADSLQFGVGRGAKGGINKIRVKLNVNDLYDVEFFKIRGVDVKLIEEAKDVYAEDLKRIFKEASGFDVSL